MGSGRRWRRRLVWSGALVLCTTGLVFAFKGCTLVKAQSNRARIGKTLLRTQALDRAHMAPTRNIPVVHLYGSPEEMGAQYGALLAEPLCALDAYVNLLLPETMREQYMATAAAKEPHLPDPLRRELKAMADASGAPYMTLVAINVIAKMRCSALAVWGERAEDGTMLVGRNAEYFGLGLSDRGSLIVVYHPDDGEPLAAVSFLGMVGAHTGVNASGVCFGNLLVFNASARATRRDGMPIALHMRLAAHKAATAEDMAESLRAASHAIPVNVMIADPRNALVLELAPNASRTRTSSDGALAVTNYFRTAEMRNGDASCERYDTLIEAVAEPMSVKAMERALHSARVKNLNLAAVVFEPEAMRMRVSLNRVPASAGPFTEFDLVRLFQGK